MVNAPVSGLFSAKSELEIEGSSPSFVVLFRVQIEPILFFRDHLTGCKGPQLGTFKCAFWRTIALSPSSPRPYQKQKAHQALPKKEWLWTDIPRVIRGRSMLKSDRESEVGRHAPYGHYLQRRRIRRSISSQAIDQAENWQSTRARRCKFAKTEVAAVLEFHETLMRRSGNCSSWFVEGFSTDGEEPAKNCCRAYDAHHEQVTFPCVDVDKPWGSGGIAIAPKTRGPDPSSEVLSVSRGIEQGLPLYPDIRLFLFNARSNLNNGSNYIPRLLLTRLISAVFEVALNRLVRGGLAVISKRASKQITPRCFMMFLSL
ncbi:hypothetical protein BKA70DRAFT_1525167 [Coprinopsis sp. MPI-PUGE-AT-0042]|nr:hypothetical protein BKA70DRAFT_1525167 [Coprinopsis sp. MPI-PUGE-AT-0042]